MEAQIPPSGATAGVPGSLRGVPGAGKSEFVAAARDRASGIQPGTDELDVHPESRRRRSRLAAANRGDAAGALSADRAAATVPNDPRAQPTHRHQEIRHHVRVFAGLQHDLSQPSSCSDAAADVQQAPHEIFRSAVHGRDHPRQQQAQTRPEAEEGRHMPFDLQELRHDITGHARTRGEKTVAPG